MFDSFDDDKPLAADTHYTKTVTVIMEDWYKNKDTLVVDGILTTTGDYKTMATEWKGNRITLVEIEPSSKESFELSKWKGKRINLHLCGHEDYDLCTFIQNMNDWDGDTLCIGYSGPKIFTDKFADSFNNPKYNKLYFKNCRISDHIIDIIKRNAPNLIIRNYEK